MFVVVSLLLKFTITGMGRKVLNLVGGPEFI